MSIESTAWSPEWAEVEENYASAKYSKYLNFEPSQQPHCSNAMTKSLGVILNLYIEMLQL